MSTIICLKDGGTMLLATDSRYMKHDFSGVASDGARKIFELAPGTFIAPSGYLGACEFQLTKARELTAELGTDIQVLAAALQRESVSHLQELAETLKSIQHLHEKIGRALAGELTLHAVVLAGRTADGSLGFISQAYRVVEGRVVCQMAMEYFGEDGRLHTTSGPPAEEAVAEDPTILCGSPLDIVRKLLAALKRRCPNIGGPDQIVQVDGRGARWISRPPSETAGETRLMNADALFGGQATFASLGGGKLIINSAGIAIQNTVTSPTVSVALSSSALTISGPSGSLVANSGGIKIQNSGSSVTVAPSAVAIVNGTLTLALNGVTTTIANGFDSYSGSYAGVTCAGAGASRSIMSPSTIGCYDAGGYEAFVATESGQSSLSLFSASCSVYAQASTNASISINGQQVVQARMGAVASPAGGSVIDVEARVAIDAIRAVLSAALGGHGLTA